MFLLYTYAHANLLPDDLSDDEWRAIILRKMFIQPDIAVGTYFGIGLLVCGVWLATGPLVRQRR